MSSSPSLPHALLRSLDRVIFRVSNLPSAVRYYRDVMRMKLIREDARLASFSLGDGAVELVLHADPDLPDHAFYFLVDDVRDLYNRRAELKLAFASPPAPSSRGYRATARDPFGNVLLLLDRTSEQAASSHIEDGKAPGTLFAGVEPRLPTKRELLIDLYLKIGRTADDLPYTPHFESLFSDYAAAHPDPKPTRSEVWRHLLNLRKGRKLPRLGEARSVPPEISPDARRQLRDMLGEDIGRRDRLPYTDRFEQLVDEFNRTQPRALSPHHVWRLVATLAK